MKLKTLLVLGAAGTAVYLFSTKQGKRQAQQFSGQASELVAPRLARPGRFAMTAQHRTTWHWRGRSRRCSR